MLHSNSLRLISPVASLALASATFSDVTWATELLAAFRETGPGWQQRINAALADWLRTHAPSELAVSRGAAQPDDRS